MDSQTIKTFTSFHLADQGTNAGKRIIGRKRHLGCDILGLLLTDRGDEAGVGTGDDKLDVGQAAGGQ